MRRGLVAGLAVVLVCGCGASDAPNGPAARAAQPALDPGPVWATQLSTPVTGFGPSASGTLLALHGAGEATALSSSGALLGTRLFAPGFDAVEGSAVPGSDDVVLWGRMREVTGVSLPAVGTYEPALQAFLVDSKMAAGCAVLGSMRDVDGRTLTSTACPAGVPSVVLTPDAQGRGGFTLASAVPYLTDVSSASAALGREGALRVALTVFDPTLVAGQRLGRRSGLVVFSVDRDGNAGSPRAVDASGVFTQVLGVTPGGEALILLDNQDVERIVSVSENGLVTWSTPAAARQVMASDGTLVLARQEGCSFLIERVVQGASSPMAALRLQTQPTQNCESGVTVQALAAVEGAVYVGGRFTGDVDFAGSALRSAEGAGFVLKLPLSSLSR